VLDVIESKNQASENNGLLIDQATRPVSNMRAQRTPVSQERLSYAKRSYASSRIDLGLAKQLVSSDIAPQTGDLVLARISKLGHHKRIESPQGRRANLFVGDEVLLCYGARYASDQFEAIVPDDLSACHMVAAGGIAARCINRHDKTRVPTRITPIGLVSDAWGRVLNLRQFACTRVANSARRPLTVAVLGTSMNSGKTTTAAAFVRGLTAQGCTVGAVKVTGTGAGCDRWAYVDAGANQVMDFTDFGYASTYQVPIADITQVLTSGVDTLARNGCDVVVVEVADGLFFSETAQLVSTSTFRTLVDGIVLTASDSMGALAGRSWLKERGLTPWAIAGCLTSSPLAVRETRNVVSEPIVSLDDLGSGCWMPEVLMKRMAAPA
jgi:hypothetical protein